MLGSWADPIQTVGGVFVRKSSGDIARYKVLGVVSAAINDAGTIMGTYAVAETHHGFLLDSHGNVITFDGPETDPSGTTALAINGDGAITGSYADTSGANYGFLRDPSGVITSFDVLHMAGSYGTLATGINAAGSIAGYYYDPSMVAHGFVRRPVNQS